MPRSFAISDIHGCNKTFQALLDAIAFSKLDTLYLLGDFVDRGPDSKGVIDTIWQMQADGYTIHCLLGNHEQIALRDLNIYRRFRHPDIGDKSLLASFGAFNMEEIPEKYYKWMQALPRYREIPGYILVHAGLDFNTNNPFSNEEALTWIRNWYHLIRRDWLDGRIIVHGHTPVGSMETLNMLANLKEMPVLDIDCGAAFTTIPHLGELCAFDLTNRRLYFQSNVD